MSPARQPLRQHGVIGCLGFEPLGIDELLPAPWPDAWGLESFKKCACG